MTATGRRTAFFLAVLAIAAGLFPALAVAGPYAFVNIADTTTPVPGGGTFTDFRFGATAGGEVAFHATIQGAPSGSNQGIFRGNGGPLSTVIRTGDATAIGALTSVGRPSLNNGVVAFTGTGASTHGVFVSTGGVHTLIAQVGDPAPSGTFSEVGNGPGDLMPAKLSNAGGTVAFYGMYGSAPHPSGIFAGAGGAIATIAKTGDVAPVGAFATTLSNDPPSISGPSVAFIGRYNDRPIFGTDSGIFLASGDSVSTLLKEGDPAPLGMFIDLRSPSLSGNSVAFAARYEDFSTQQHAVMTISGGALTTIASSTTPAPWGTFGDSALVTAVPSNVGGMVAFFAMEAISNHGIFVGNGGPLTTIIKTGDALFGSAVGYPGFGGLATSQFSLDAQGTRNIGFSYTLADGRYGIGMAVYIPEPPTGVMLGLIATAIVGARRRVAWREE